MKHLLLFSLSFLISFFASGQKLEPELISSQGGIIEGEKMNLQWTLGETVIETAFTGNGIVSQGFIQPNSIQVFSVNLFESNVNKFRVSPNPSTSVLNIENLDADISKAQLLLNDSKGNEISVEIVENGIHIKRLDLSNLQGGLYVLTILDIDGSIESHRIIKVN